MAIDTAVNEGIAEVVINNPPVNALDSAGWFEFAAAVTSLGARDDVRCMVIRAEGRGFQAGVDSRTLEPVIYSPADDSTWINNWGYRATHEQLGRYLKTYGWI